MGDLTEQIVVRVDPDMRQALERVAEASERTVAQQVRYILRLSLRGSDG